MDLKNGPGTPGAAFSGDGQKDEFTREGLFGGAMTVLQPKRGYRYSLDSVLLANSVCPARNQRVLDLGAGCGVISLILAWRHPDLEIHGVEIQPVLARAACMNVMENRLSGRITVICSDMRRLDAADLGGPVDWVVANPPYGKAGGGRLGPDSAKTAAKHEVFGDLADVTQASFRVLKVSGTLAAVYPAQRLADLVFQLRKARLEPKWLRAVHSSEGADAGRVIVMAVKYGRPGMRVEPPLYVHRPDGSYTPEVKRMFEP